MCLVEARINHIVLLMHVNRFDWRLNRVNITVDASLSKSIEPLNVIPRMVPRLTLRAYQMRRVDFVPEFIRRGDPD